jgi:hypothetical protein
MLEIVTAPTSACMWQPRPKRTLHDKAELGPIEENWRNLRTYFKTEVKKSGFVAPMSALEGIEHFIARVETLNRLVDQQARDAETHRVLVEQDKELPTIVDEFRANGFRAISLSSSPSDDDIEEANIAAKHLGHVAPAFGPDKLALDEVAPVLRRIEWERYMLACSLPIKAIVTVDGNVVAERPDTPLDLVAQMGKKMKNAILHDWAYGPSPQVNPIEQSFDELGADELMTRRTPELVQGPQELGLHNFDDEGIAPEPNEQELEAWAEFERMDAWVSSAA